MKKKIALITSIISITIVVLFLNMNIIAPVYATWYNVNSDPDLNNPSSWGIGLWRAEATHDYWINGGKAYTYLHINEGYTTWGNTQYGQGNDVWSTWGDPLPYKVYLNTPQRLITMTKRTAYGPNWFGARANTFWEAWATNGTDFVEFMVILDSRNLFNPYPFENGYFSFRGEWGGALMGYRHWNQGTDWTYRETNLNWIYQIFENDYGADLSEWWVAGTTFGIEATNAYMGAEWEYVKWEIGM